MPCLAVPVNAGNKAKSFLSFSESIAANKSHYFDESQQFLNRLCLAMLKEAEQLEKNIEWNGHVWHWEHYHKLFQLWQQCWPLLCTQPQVYYSHFYWLKYIKGKPRLRETIPVSVSPETVSPKFALKKYPDHQRLSMQLPHQNKQLRSQAGRLPFFVDCPESDCFYLLPSLNMAQLVCQMHDADPFISVFKQQSKSFQKEVITPLQKQGFLVIPQKKNPKTKQQSQNTKQDNKRKKRTK